MKRFLMRDFHTFRLLRLYPLKTSLLLFPECGYVFGERVGDGYSRNKTNFMFNLCFSKDYLI